MIDSQKLFTFTVSLIVVLSCDRINGENRLRNNFVSKIKTKTTIPNQVLNTRDIVPAVAETKAQHSVLSAGHDLKTAAGHHGGGGGGGGHGGHGYFQYARVPHKGAWEFGYKRGNPHHHREQHEQGHGHQFKTKLRWGDKHGGHGEHYWDYNHAPKHHGKHGGGGGGHGKYGHG